MDSQILKKALLIDPVPSAVFEDHGVSKSVLSFLNFEIDSNQIEPLKIIAGGNGNFTIGVNSRYNIEDPAEFAHSLVHIIVGELEEKPEKFAFSSEQIQDLNDNFLQHEQPTLREYNRYSPLYQMAFFDPKAGYIYFDRLFREAQKKKSLHQLRFNSEEQIILNQLRKTALRMQVRIYVVGGCIRDKLLGLENTDLDFMVVTDDLDKFVQNLQKEHNLRDPVKLERSQAYTFRFGTIDVDIIDARRVYVPLERGKEDSLEEEDDWSIALDDIFRRDLTINAIVYDILKNQVLDPTRRGFRDLRNGIINTIIDPYVKYRINAFDMLRALRFAAVYEFKLGPEMLNAMKTNAHRLVPRNLGGDISNRRILRELRKAAKNAKSWYQMKKLLADTGLINQLSEDVEKVEVQRTTLSEGKEENV